MWGSFKGRRVYLLLGLPEEFIRIASPALGLGLICPMSKSLSTWVGLVNSQNTFSEIVTAELIDFVHSVSPFPRPSEIILNLDKSCGFNGFLNRL